MAGRMQRRANLPGAPLPVEKGPGAVAVREGVIKRSLSIAGHATSISLEEPFWQALKRIAEGRGVTLAALVAEIDGRRARTNLSSALRIHVLEVVSAEAEVRGAAPPCAD
jgi:predicted DNA-binding ribbon-helix-helix protein